MFLRVIVDCFALTFKCGIFKVIPKTDDLKDISTGSLICYVTSSIFHYEICKLGKSVLCKNNLES